LAAFKVITEAGAGEYVGRQSGIEDLLEAFTHWQRA
jgi:hypothetical protein